MNPEMLEEYNKKGEVDQSLVDSYGESLLSKYITTTSTVDVQEKLKKYTNIDINKQYNSNKQYSIRSDPRIIGDTLLHKICRTSYLNISKIKLLLDNGAKPVSYTHLTLPTKA